MYIVGMDIIKNLRFQTKKGLPLFLFVPNNKSFKITEFTNRYHFSLKLFIGHQLHIIK